VASEGGGLKTTIEGMGKVDIDRTVIKKGRKKRIEGWKGRELAKSENSRSKVDVQEKARSFVNIAPAGVRVECVAYLASLDLLVLG